MWKSIVSKAQELIKIAETIKGMTGPEKKAYVVNGLCGYWDIPFIPQWVERIIYGYVVDLLVRLWNYLINHKLAEIPANEETAEAMAELVEIEVNNIMTGKTVENADLDERFDDLLAKYGVATS